MRREGGGRFAAAQKTNYCVPLSSGIVERRQRRSREEEEEEFLSFFLSLPLFIFSFLLAIQKQGRRKLDTVIIRQLLFLGKPPPVTFEETNDDNDDEHHHLLALLAIDFVPSVLLFHVVVVSMA